MTLAALGLRILHAAAAIALVGWLATVMVGRRDELAKVREVSDRDRAEVERMRSELARSQALRDGLRRDDPYVVEYLARERLQLSGPGELAPPPRDR